MGSSLNFGESSVGKACRLTSSEQAGTAGAVYGKLGEGSRCPSPLDYFLGNMRASSSEGARFQKAVDSFPIFSPFMTEVLGKIQSRLSRSYFTPRLPDQNRY